MRNDFYSGYLMHHGIQGQKWGVKNGPPYPLKKEVHNQVINSNIVNDSIKAGTVSKTVNPDKQKRHTLDDHISGRSYLNGNIDYAQELVDKLSGTGKPKVDQNGNWTKKEMVINNEPIGFYVNSDGKEIESKAATIVYSKTGSHIYPRKE